MSAPSFSILTPVYNPPLDVLEATIASVRAQTYADWEWIVVDDCSTDPRVREVLATAATEDARITMIARPTNGHIVVASNDALAAARGIYVVFLDHDDLLTPDALARMAELLGQADDFDYVYSDEDKVGADGHFYDTFLKPAWSPERLRGQMYTSHLSVMRRSVVVEVGGFREGYEGSQDHDLALRVTEVARRVGHLVGVHYHWRVVPGSAAGAPDAKPYTQSAGLRAVNDHLARVGIRGRAVDIPGHPGQYRIERELDPGHRVSIVIPTMGQSGRVWGAERVFVVEAVRSALAHTNHADVEVVVVYDPPTPAKVLDELRQIAGNRLVLVPYRKPFNFSEKINVGFLASTGSRVVLLNDDVEIRSDGWLEQLVAPLDEPDVGMTGARLYFSDGTLQHVGHHYEGGDYHHTYLGWPGDSSGTMSDIIINREVSGVTAACAALRREVFESVGGLCEDLPVNFNDVDLSYKVRQWGGRILYIANCELYHFESRTRPRGIHAWEHERALARWGRPAVDDFHPVPKPTGK